MTEDHNKPRTAKQKAIRDRVAEPMSYRFEDPIRVDEREELAFFANEAGTRLDWHEPDEQDLTAMVYGTGFDNAGSWGEATYEYFTNEMHVVLYVQHYPVASVNLATLFAWATEDKRDWGLSEKAIESESGEIVDAEIVDAEIVETRELEQ